MRIDKQFLLKRILPILAGAILGYGYYYFVGCRTDSCPITSNPFSSIIYGALIGAIASFPSKKKELPDEKKWN